MTIGKIGPKDIFGDDDESMSEFIETLKTDGFVISYVEDGLVIGMSNDRLEELLELCDEDPNKRVIIFIKDEPETKPTELPN